MGTINRNGFSISYEVKGQGSPLLLIAGLGLDSSPWTQAVEVLQEDFQCVLIDNRGTGKSDTPPGPYTIDEMADDVIAVMDDAGITRASAVGWSMGGSILQSLLSRYQDRFDKGVLLSALPYYTKVMDAWLDCLKELRASDLSAATQSMFGMPWAFTPRVLLDHDAAWAMAQMNAANPGVASNEAYEYQSTGLRNYDARPHLPNVTAEVLVLVGAEDVLTPPKQAVEMAELIPNGHLMVLPRGSHGMVLEYPDDTLGAIRNFLGQGAEETAETVTESVSA